MKTIIITIGVAMLLSISNTFGSNKLYKNVVGNKESGVVTSTVCQGSNEGSLTPLTQNVFHYNSDKILTERTSYKWDSSKNAWVVISRHTYEYSNDGKLANVSYSQWNKSTQSWSNEVIYAMYIYDAGNEYSLVKYLTVADTRNKVY